MTIEVAEFERALKIPFRYGHTEVFSRKGFYLREKTDAGVFYSEASPLPGHSKDNIDACRKYFSSRGLRSIPPSIRFALAGIASLKKCSAHSILGGVESNALIPWHEEHTLDQISKASSAGYKTIKLKIFPKNIEKIPAILKSVASAYPHLKVRLDANQSLSTKEFAAFCAATEEVATIIEYIEEPTLHCFEQKNYGKIPMAADESANSCEQISALATSEFPPSFFILKPTVLGEIPLINSGIITSALETEAGRRSILAHLYLNPSKFSVGLNTGFLFKENFWRDRPVFSEKLIPNKEEVEFYGSLSWSGIQC